jgi:hypothetical protein
MRLYSRYKRDAIALRRAGKTYSEIGDALGMKFPKSTLSTWFSRVVFSSDEMKMLHIKKANKIDQGRINSLRLRDDRRKRRFQETFEGLAHLPKLLQDSDVAKISLMMVYWCEGGKRRRSSLTFGNSDPLLIGLFLKLLRLCYSIDEGKFRCTIQCRADHDPDDLKRYWSAITGIRFRQFYPAQIDRRTEGKPSKKPDYKGVCRIDYFSAEIYHEMMMANKLFV